MFKQFFLKNRKQITAVFGLFFVAGLLFKVGTLDLQTNLIANNKVKSFNGTTLPILKAPDWSALTKAEWTAHYDKIPSHKLLDFPKYDLNLLKTPRSKIDGKDKALRNLIITISVYYLGNYKLDGGEGGHPAIDIKVPMGTPVYAIANGEVVKTSLQENGFGHHIVIKHANVPSYEDPNVLTTYYSSYSHLSDVLATEGQIVEKGQLIAKTGQTGTATTPHLHFQIDKENAPWHPYWHFTAQEAAKAGYDFTSAINAGFQKDKALQTTIDPLLYVQKYAQGYQASSNTTQNTTNSSTNSSNSFNSELPPTTTNHSINTSQQDTTKNTQQNTNSTQTNDTELPPVSEDTSAEPTAQAEAPKLKEFKIEMNQNFTVNREEKIKVSALDENKKIIKGFKPSSEVYINVENGSGTLSTTYLKAFHFQDGAAEISITPLAEFGIRISASHGSIKSLSNFMQPTGNAASNVVETTTTASTQVTAGNLFTDVSSSNPHYKALSFLKENNIIRGYSDGSFQPEKIVSRVEALKFIYEGLKKPLKKNVAIRFTDVDKKAWYIRYLMTAYSEGIVKGYENNLFKPGNAVTKAEFLKMLFVAADFDTAAVKISVKPFDDVSLNDWHAQYVQYGKDKNLIEAQMEFFKPNDGMTRAEVAEVLYRTIALKVSKTSTYSTTLVVSNDIFNQYFKN